MSRWSDRVEELLYDGETVAERVEVGTAAVVVTSHRVLAFTPERDGPNFQQADRPNVTGVSVESGGDSTFLRYAVRATIYGLVLIVAGLLLPLDAILSDVAMPESTGQLGIGGVLGLFEQLLSLLRNLDEFMQLAGALLLLFAIVPFGVYLWSRERSLVIDLAEADESIRLPAPDSNGETIADGLERAILPGTDHEAG
ncbi:hypothetical protein [Halapricum hydrolyticum]|uniref:Uncharacterized protein n=1 Tax=Halapricum hydrolyticum TaxID=2979991 RepID=A0AAE3LEQ3_9EURY|nr:hypothetical protein [Halapricum hydrolyticum]MCU4717468.1 hypothetical protein [Halapricum hydrolyticum]MCU4726632.1 hypothetical protein [Halapricum hydrolyticum]